MDQSTMTIGTGRTDEVIGGILLVGSAIASWITITDFLARVVKQDPLLVFLMTVVAIAIAGVVYKMFWIRRVIVPVIIAFVASVVLAVISWSLLAGSGVTPIKVSIIDPQDGVSVTMQYLAKGTVSDPDARVYVIVHPLKVPEMWVQQPPIVDAQGNWQSAIYFGTETLGIGERYEVIALATNDNFLLTRATDNSLSEGQKLTSLPRKSNRSNFATVTRPK